MKLTRTETYSCYEESDLTEEIADKLSFVKFTHGDYTNDESAYERDGRLYCSSYANGIIKWNDDQKQYIHSYHMSQYPMGQIEYMAILDDTAEAFSDAS